MRNTKQILQVAATYIGTVVGAGFATGKEIVEFFISSGILGLLGILLTGICFIWIGTKIMTLAHRARFRSYEQFNHYLFGQRVGSLVNLLFLIILFGSTSVMISGTGSLFYEQMGIPAIWGTLLIVGLCFFVMLKGLKGILTVNSLVVPIMILFTLLMAFFTLSHGAILNRVQPSGLLVHSSWLMNAFIYISYNLTMSEVILVPLGGEMENEKIVKWGGFWGGLGLTVILLASFLVLYALPNVQQYNIPMAESVRSLGVFIHFLYVFVVFGEIFSTVIGNVFGLSRQIHDRLHFPEYLCVLMILFVCILISQIDFGILLPLFYRFFGGISLFIFIFIVFYPLSRLNIKK
ncbi:putative membrane protein YkvI [Pullulanibacillus pueri]|uniref:Membrane protein n=1 Tax=Pullulanibacillus pueri TaxID=1437324 RepID=A0A8J3EMK8_9BACL|nr:hypothetical protein [Pullulanibacillus pueri]MBM7680629.1 putative membrane protein YkvI [Pullulanibacillus pueri]GGH83893.1 membrane protein [Pullulanibacillus pueri]